MRITQVTPMVLGTAWRDLTFVKVETDEGLTGVGEARVLNRTEAVLGYLSEAAPRYVVGSDPFEIERLVTRMFREDFERADAVVMTGIALVEIACWDIIGKALGQPVYRLLGGAVREKIKAYANGWYTVERSPQEFHAAARKVVAKGYRAMKLDPFGAGFYELERDEKLRSIALVEAVRDAVGPDVEIMVEMHGRFSPASAAEMARSWRRSSRAGSRNRRRRRTSSRSRRPRTPSRPWASRSRQASGCTRCTTTGSCSSSRPPTSSSPISRTWAGC